MFWLTVSVGSVHRWVAPTHGRKHNTGVLLTPWQPGSIEGKEELGKEYTVPGDTFNNLPAARPTPYQHIQL